MRILHTADWHLGQRLGWQSRDDDLARAVAHVGQLCRRHAVDVLLVAGDIFDGHMDPETLRRWTEFLADTFREFLHAGGTILAITGNHESEHQCQTLRAAMELAVPAPPGADGVSARGRLYLTSTPTRLTLADADGTRVQFLLMPYPTPGRYSSRAVQTARGRDAQRAALLAEYRARLSALRSGSDFDGTARTVLAAHVGVAGALLPNRTRLEPTQALCLSQADLETSRSDSSAGSAELDYVALGDVHLGQTLFGRETVRYSGSLERMDLGEAGDAKHVVLVDIGPSGLRGPPTELPLPARAVYEVRIDNWAEQAAGLAERFPDRERALVKLSVRWRPGQDNLDEIQARLADLFPHVYNRDCQEVAPQVGRAARAEPTARAAEAAAARAAEAAAPGAAGEPPSPTADVATEAVDSTGSVSRLSSADTVREYLAARLAGSDTDPADRDELLRLAEEFLVAEGLS